PDSLWEFFVDRIVWFAGWIAGLFWDLFYDSRVLRPYILLLGWISLIGLATTVYCGLKRRTWLWAAIALQMIALGLIWPNVIPRYIMQMAPLILFAIWHGFEHIAAVSKSRPVGIIVKTAIALGLASIFISNLAEYALEVWVQRSAHFYRHFEGGL